MQYVTLVFLATISCFQSLQIDRAATQWYFIHANILLK